MATGAVNSLGIGSGVLTSDIIDKLKTNDTNLIIAPIDKKITTNTQKQDSMSLLSSLATSLYGAASSLEDSALYQKRTTSGSNSSVSVTADAGVAIQDFTVSNVKMATTNVLQSGSFASTTATLATGSGQLKLNVDGTDYTIDYTSSMTYEDLKTKINDVAGDKVKASILQTSDTGYSLILNSKNTGAAQKITLTDLGGTLSSTLTTEMSSIQDASDASFKYNGITLTRASNKVTDIALGLTINLLSNTTTETANVSVTQDAQPIKDAMQNLVDSYNTLSKQLTAMTQVDLENKSVGLFNGDSSINNIDREIKRIITSTSSTGLSMTQYGININENGTLSFDSSAFDKKMAENPDAMAEYFSGKTTVNSAGTAQTVDGVFTTLFNNLNNLTKTDGVLNNLVNGLKTEATTLKTDKTRATDALNARYNTMTQQFIAYDAIISNLNNQFSSLSQQISMAVNGK